MKTVKSALTPDEGRYIAKLANLKLSEDQLKKILPALSAVLNYMSKIQTLDTTDVEETSQVTGLENVFREDKVETERILSQEEALSNAKKTHNGYFVIDAIFD